MPLKGLCCGAARQRTLTLGRVHYRRKEFGHSAETFFGATIDVVERLTENELTIAGVVPDVAPIADQTPGAGLAVECLMHLAPCRPSINAADDEVYRAVIAAALKRPSFFREEFLVRVERGGLVAVEGRHEAPRTKVHGSTS